VAEGRDERKAILDSVVEIVQRERDVYPKTAELVAEVEHVLECMLYDREAALAVLRGEADLDDDPWARCPHCDCDTYFRLRFAAEQIGGANDVIGPLWLFVCEGCQYTVTRARATYVEGLWWTRGVRVRAKPEEVGHPYRGDVDPTDEEDDDDADEAEAEAEPPVEWSERKVCPDGACIGIIGEGGKCNVCGRAEATP